MIRLQKVSVGAEELNEISKVFETGNLTQGEKTREFENLVSKYLKTKYALAMSSATTGLNIALAALNIKPGDEVIMPAFSFPATANSVIQLGAHPVFIDIDISTYNIDINLINEKINSKTKAIMPVHAFGLMSDMQGIKSIAEYNRIPIIEDAACALGSDINGEMAGTIGDFGVFSFHPRKVITTGEGGIVTTANDELAERIKILRSHGSVKGDLFLEFIDAGFNYRLSDVNSAIGVVQMKKLRTILESRASLAKIYNEKLSEIEEIQIPITPYGYSHSFQSYVIRLKSAGLRDKIIRDMADVGIETTLGTYGMHLQPYFIKRYGIKPEDFQQATIAHEQCLTLPLYHEMSISDLEYVVENFIKIFRNAIGKSQ